MKKKIKVAILFGGKSAEHEVSLQSARNVAAAIDKNKYDVIAIGIDKSGKWLPSATSKHLLNSDTQKIQKVSDDHTSIALIPEGEGIITNSGKEQSDKIDVVFPVLHGPFGEDGTVQGLFKLAHIPFVGAGVLGSAVGMDKDVTKRLLRDAKLPIGKFIVIKKSEKVSFRSVANELGIPMFIKPANLGSSVGVSKVKNEKEFKLALKDAFQYDTKIIAEEFIDGREIECSVLGNDKPIASVPGEVIVKHEYYSYDAKYVDENGAALEIPAKVGKNTIKQIQKLAVETFKVLGCEGMARVDFFLKKNGKVIVNEINTIPGFTNISMYPKLWEASGISAKELTDRLIQLALERFAKEQKLKTSLDKFK